MEGVAAPTLNGRSKIRLTTLFTPTQRSFLLLETSVADWWLGRMSALMEHLQTRCQATVGSGCRQDRVMGGADELQAMQIAEYGSHCGMQPEPVVFGQGVVGWRRSSWQSHWRRLYLPAVVCSLSAPR